MASPCAACKFLRRKCTNGCVFAPYFPPDQPTKFANVHKIFGASNVAKLLTDLTPQKREDAVNSLAYEADARIKDPVYGCVAYISMLQVKIKEAQDQLNLAKKELSSYIGPSAFSPFLPPAPLITQNRVSAATPSPYMAGSFGFPNVGIGMDLALASSGAMSSHHGVPFRDAVEAQQLFAIDAMRGEPNMLRFSAAIDGMRGYDGHFTTNLATAMQGTVELVSPQPAQIHHQHQNPQQQAQQQAFENVFVARPPPQPQMQLQNQQQTHPQVQQQMQLYMEPMKQHQQHRRVGSDEGRSCIRPTLP